MSWLSTIFVPWNSLVSTQNMVFLEWWCHMSHRYWLVLWKKLKSRIINWLLPWKLLPKLAWHYNNQALNKIYTHITSFGSHNSAGDKHITFSILAHGLKSMPTNRGIFIATLGFWDCLRYDNVLVPLLNIYHS
jgi:hypothetical protein